MRIFILVIAITISSKCFAVLMILNTTNERVKVAIAYSKNNVMYTKGWIQVEPNELLIDTTIPTSPTYYYYAKSLFNIWDGDYAFYIDDKSGNTKFETIQKAPFSISAKKYGFKKVDFDNTKPNKHCIINITSYWIKYNTNNHIYPTERFENHVTPYERYKIWQKSNDPLIKLNKNQKK